MTDRVTQWSDPMAVDAAEEPSTESVQPPIPGAGGAYARRILRAVLDVIELEFQIITLRILVAMREVVVRTCLALAAVAFALAGVVFLEIAIFRALAHVVPVIWVWFIFAIGHLILAGSLVFLAARPADAGSDSQKDSVEPVGGRQR
jgi:hypothetical protein